MRMPIAIGGANFKFKGVIMILLFLIILAEIRDLSESLIIETSTNRLSTPDTAKRRVKPAHVKGMC